MNRSKRKPRYGSRSRRLSARTAPPPEAPESDEDTLVEPDDALPEIEFSDLPGPLQEAAGRAGWASLMPVQATAIPYVLAKRDLMIQSRTGSGKTGAFLLPILDRIDTTDKSCQALILVPTRELAGQVAEQAELLGGAEVETAAVYGGVGYGPQIDAFQRGAPIVVGTPGRVLDHLLKGTLKLDRLRVLVLDEADRMLSMGFYPDMQRLQQYLPSSDNRNAYMFSATFPAVVKSLASEFLVQPDFLSLSRDRVHVAETEHAFYEVPAMDKDRVLIRIIEMENPHSAIIFCNTKSDVRYVSVVLRRFGYDADELSSDLSQGAREKVLTRVREGTLRFLVATDVAARGIDILELSHVIQYGPPQDPEDYIHRVGRTSRAGATGEALTLVSGMEPIHLKHIARTYRIDMEERTAPTKEEVESTVAQRVTTLLEAKLRERSALERERMQRFLPLARSLGETDDEIAIVAMLLDDHYQESLHAPVGGRKPHQEPERVGSAKKDDGARKRPSGGRGRGRGR